MRLPYLLLSVTFSTLLSACANLNTVHRSLNLSSNDSAKAVAIDGYQQPIFSHYTIVDGNGNQLGENGTRQVFIVCPNPPVEAITASGLSTALTNGFKAGQAAAGAGPTNDTQAALVNAVASASIGLRTNSTTLLSYNSTANCLAYMGGATKDRKFMELARRNQNITMAILAIEQLTGVAQAGQASMSTSGSSGTGTEDLKPLLTALDDAQKAANTAKTSLASASSEREKALKNSDERTKARIAAEEKETELKKAKAEQSKLEEAAKSVADSKDAEATAKENLSAANQAVEAANREVKGAEQQVKTVQGMIDVAQHAVRANASAVSDVGQGQGPRISATSAVAKAVVEIVKVSSLAISEDENCAAIMEEYRLAKSDTELAKWNTPGGLMVLGSCAIGKTRAAYDRSHALALASEIKGEKGSEGKAAQADSEKGEKAPPAKKPGEAPTGPKAFVPAPAAPSPENTVTTVLDALSRAAEKRN